MPYTPKQHRLFEAAAHNSTIAKQFGIPMKKAKEMASEGVKTSDRAKKEVKKIKRK
jgi:hypothetical protein